MYGGDLSWTSPDVKKQKKKKSYNKYFTRTLSYYLSLLFHLAPDNVQRFCSNHTIHTQYQHNGGDRNPMMLLVYDRDHPRIVKMYKVYILTPYTFMSHTVFSIEYLVVYYYYHTLLLLLLLCLPSDNVQRASIAKKMTKKQKMKKRERTACHTDLTSKNVLFLYTRYYVPTM